MCSPEVLFQFFCLSPVWHSPKAQSNAFSTAFIPNWKKWQKTLRPGRTGDPQPKRKGTDRLISAPQEIFGFLTFIPCSFSFFGFWLFVCSLLLYRGPVALVRHPCTKLPGFSLINSCLYQVDGFVRLFGILVLRPVPQAILPVFSIFDLLIVGVLASRETVF